ncbi:MAG: trehalose-phosphatase [Rhodopirellula sp.]|nr:trehalose-phosphatase [Rhodopirellula sp.]
MDETPSVNINGVAVDAVILDLDGVITRTARVHSAAWKQMFDEFLRKRAAAAGEEFQPFDIAVDYTTYVDGMPRYDGVRTFLASRGIELPWGSPGDLPDAETVCGLGNRKNVLFHELIEEVGVEVYEDAVERIEDWRRRGLATAVVSSSKNCEQILRIAGLAHLFDTQVDGVEAARTKLPGKPAPDTFLKAAERLNVEARRAVVIEDAVAGVQAGRAGSFGLVVGVARRGPTDALAENGADVVVRNLGELTTEGTVGLVPPPSAVEYRDEIAGRLADRRPAIFLDYDGTLTPIVPDPAAATLAPEVRQLIDALSKLCRLAIVSGRDLQDVKRLVGLDDLVYAGSHGFEIVGPGGLHMEHEEGRRRLPGLDTAEKELRQRLAAVPRSAVERKRFAVAIHYRNVDEARVAEVERAVDEVHGRHPSLRKRGGKKIFELQPNIEWHKGKAVLWLLDALGLDKPDVLPFYLGDDVTDEDAFRALADRGIGILVGKPTVPTAASYWLSDTADVKPFLEGMIDLLSKNAP